ncbi:hypothetical protein ElyMa_001396400 [Elysia marginata]|uniref:RNase H type-1 domain-containing protein n=1 Tax=Elysia marginata TaxID=1093978 RepID=A0AAV4IUE1_9GAST|nr:hypothetical protein ElyMa_001396400 [Elysia marginata]
MLTIFTMKLFCQWIPGHTNLPSNDQLTKQRSKSEQSQRPITLQTARQINKENHKVDWINLWSRVGRRERGVNWKSRIPTHKYGQETRPPPYNCRRKNNVQYFI